MASKRKDFIINDAIKVEDYFEKNGQNHPPNRGYEQSQKNEYRRRPESKSRGDHDLEKKTYYLQGGQKNFFKKRNDYPEDKIYEEDDETQNKDYEDGEMNRNSSQTGSNEYVIAKHQMSAIEEEDKRFQNSMTEGGMTISEIDNLLMQSTNCEQGNDNMTDLIENITDIDLRKLLQHYDVDDNTFLHNSNDVSYSNISQMQQSVSNYLGESKDDITMQTNGLDAMIEKPSKYFQKFLRGENLNESSCSQITNYPQSKSIRFSTDFNGDNSNNLRRQILEAKSNQKQVFLQNKLLIQGHQRLQKQVQILAKQLKCKTLQRQEPHKQFFQEEKKEKIQEKSNEDARNNENNSKQENISHHSHQENKDSQLQLQLQLQLQEEINKKQQQEIESLRAKVLELMQQKADAETNVKMSNLKMIELLQNELNSKDSLLKEKTEEIKRQSEQNEVCILKSRQASKLAKKNADSFTIPQPERIAGDSDFNCGENQFQKDQIGGQRIHTDQSLLLQNGSVASQIFHLGSKSANNFLPLVGNTRQINMEKINSEIRQLKNSLICTDRLLLVSIYFTLDYNLKYMLKTTRCKNQMMSEKVSQAEQIKSKLECFSKTCGGEMKQHETPLDIYHNQDIYDKQQTCQIQQHQKYIFPQVEVSHCDSIPPSSNYTPRTQQNMFPTPLKPTVDQSYGLPLQLNSHNINQFNQATPHQIDQAYLVNHQIKANLPLETNLQSSQMEIPFRRESNASYIEQNGNMKANINLGQDHRNTCSNQQYNSTVDSLQNRINYHEINDQRKQDHLLQKSRIIPEYSQNMSTLQEMNQIQHNHQQYPNNIFTIPTSPQQGSIGLQHTPQNAVYTQNQKMNIHLLQRRNTPVVNHQVRPTSDCSNKQSPNITNMSQTQLLFTNYLNTQEQKSRNQISTVKGENLKRLNKNLIELELEKNLVILISFYFECLFGYKSNRSRHKSCERRV